MTDTYLVFQDLGGAYHDAKKMGPADSNLCWAAAAANIIAWSGWGQLVPNEPPSSAQAIFEQYKAVSGSSNIESIPRVLWKWWFDTHSSSFQADLDALSLEYGMAYRKDAMPRIETCFRDHGAGVALQTQKTADQVGQSEVSHFVTCWGFDFDPALGNDDPARYIAIHITDSDDLPGDPQLRRYPVAKGRADHGQNPNYWYLQGLFGENGFFMSDIYALRARNLENGTDPLNPPTGLHILR